MSKRPARFRKPTGSSSRTSRIMDLILTNPIMPSHCAPDPCGDEDTESVVSISSVPDWFLPDEGDGAHANQESNHPALHPVNTTYPSSSGVDATSSNAQRPSLVNSQAASHDSFRNTETRVLTTNADTNPSISCPGDRQLNGQRKGIVSVKIGANKTVPDLPTPKLVKPTAKKRKNLGIDLLVEDGSPQANKDSPSASLCPPNTLCFSSSGVDATSSNAQRPSLVNSQAASHDSFRNTETGLLTTNADTNLSISCPGDRQLNGQRKGIVSVKIGANKTVPDLPTPKLVKPTAKKRKNLGIDLLVEDGSPQANKDSPSASLCPPNTLCFSSSGVDATSSNAQRPSLVNSQAASHDSFRNTETRLLTTNADTNPSNSCPGERQLNGQSKATISFKSGAKKNVPDLRSTKVAKTLSYKRKHPDADLFVEVESPQANKDTPSAVLCPAISACSSSSGFVETSIDTICLVNSKSDSDDSFCNNETGLSSTNADITPSISCFDDPQLNEHGKGTIASKSGERKRVPDLRTSKVAKTPAYKRKNPDADLYVEVESPQTYKDTPSAASCPANTTCLSSSGFVETSCYPPRLVISKPTFNNSIYSKETGVLRANADLTLSISGFADCQQNEQCESTVSLKSGAKKTVPDLCTSKVVKPPAFTRKNPVADLNVEVESPQASKDSPSAAPCISKKPTSINASDSVYHPFSKNNGLEKTALILPNRVQVKRIPPSKNSDVLSLNSFLSKSLVPSAAITGDPQSTQGLVKRRLTFAHTANVTEADPVCRDSPPKDSSDAHDEFPLMDMPSDYFDLDADDFSLLDGVDFSNIQDVPLASRQSTPRVKMVMNDSILPTFEIVDDDDNCDSPDEFETPTTMPFILTPPCSSSGRSAQSSAPSSTSNISTTQTQRVASMPPLSLVTPPSSSSSTFPTRKRKVAPRENTRKRSVNSAQWKQNKAKELYNKGEEHITPKGYHRKARKMREGCKMNCRVCRKKRISENQRSAIFNHFWKKLNSVHRKRDFISRCITSKAPATCSTIQERAKKSIRAYHFYVGSGKNKVTYRVCKKMFIDTLGVPDSWVETSLKKCENGDGMSPEKRGKHQNRPARSSPETLESVREHINLFPRMPSHYIRESSKREYLEPEVRSVQRMYRAYRKWAEDKGLSKVASCDIYRRVFNTQFNLGFFIPRKDQCEVCNKWKQAKNQVERRAILPTYKQHLENKKAVYQLKKADKSSASDIKCVACFDLQKILPCPRSETSVFFYRNKLNLYNFTVFDLRSKDGYCYLWTEVEGLKGANEVGTSLLHFIETKVKENVREFVFWSDSPSGQNRNRMVFSMYQFAAARYKVDITHRFLESGHSYSEADGIHARIENESDRKEIFTPEEWTQIIKSAKQEGNGYIVHRHKNEDFLNLHHLVDQQNWDGDSNNQRVFWSRVREIKVYHNTPDFVYYRYDFTGEPKRVVVSMKDGSHFDYESYKPPQAYKSKFPLSANKIKDLDFLCKKLAIPSRYHGLYKELMEIPRA